MKAGDPARIQLIYERALAENCLVPDLWARYNQYLVRQTEMFGVLFFIFICLFILISQWLINNSECFPNPVTLPLNFREAEISFHLFSVVYLLIKRAFAQFFPQLCIFSAEFVLLSGSQVLKTWCDYFRTGSWEWKNWSCLLTTALLGTVPGQLGSGFAIFWRWRGTELTTALFLVKKYLSKPSSQYRTTSCAMNDVWQVVIWCSPSPAVLKPMKFTVVCF